MFLFLVQGQCKPNAIEFIRIAEAPPELAVETCFRLQMYGDFRTLTIPSICHSIYHKHGICIKNARKPCISWRSYAVRGSFQSSLTMG